jgi:hypothetical protein
VYFKASESRFGALAKARFGGRSFARESPDFHLSLPLTRPDSAGDGGAPETCQRSHGKILARASEIQPDIAAHPVPSGLPRDPAGIDVENFACCVDVGEGQGVGAGHPDLRAELCQFIEQRRAPGGIEMRHHLVEQQ